MPSNISQKPLTHVHQDILIKYTKSNPLEASVLFPLPGAFSLDHCMVLSFSSLFSAVQMLSEIPSDHPVLNPNSIPNHFHPYHFLRHGSITLNHITAKHKIYLLFYLLPPTRK